MQEEPIASRTEDAAAEIARQQHKAFLRAYDGQHPDFVKEADLYEGFYNGEQWAKEDINKLREARRPAITLNMVLPTINTILGEQTNTRVDIAFKPRKAGFQEISDALAKVALQVQEANRFPWVESEVFLDGLITGRGFFDIRLDFEKDIRGEIKIRALDPRNVVLDRDAKEYDPSTWKQVWRYDYLTLDDIAVQYGKDKADQLAHIGKTRTSLGSSSVILEPTNTFADQQIDSSEHEESDDSAVVRAVRIIERQYRKLARVKFFVDHKTGDMSAVPEAWDDAKVQEFQQRFGLRILEKVAQKIRWTVTADSVMLYDDWSLYDEFSIVPYFSYFRRGKPFGVVKNIVSPQELINKTSSQELHVVNTTANSGWTVEEGSLTNMDSSELETRGAETGLVLEFAKGAQPPQKILPNQIPNGLSHISAKGAANLRSISGVNDGMLGDTSAEVSGVALKRKEARGQVQIQVPLDNLAKTRHFVASRILEIVQKYYTEERVLRITNDLVPEQGEEELVVNQMMPDGSILRDLTLGKYDVVIATQPHRDNFDESQFAEALQLRELGVAIPDHIVVGYSHLARKTELVDLLKKINGFAEPTEEEAQMMQMQQQIQAKQIELELSRLEAEVVEIQARARLQTAKAQSLTMEERIRLDELEAKITLKREELQTRIQLAMLTQQSRNKDIGSRMLMEHARLNTQRDIASRNSLKNQKH